MNDDTVPDVGMTIGFEGTKVSLHCWRKCLLPAFALAAFCANAEVEMIGSIEWKYSVDDNGKAMIVSALDYAPKHPSEISGSVTIPSTLGGCPVVGIGRRAFYSCDNLVSVAIPEGVETIGDEAFRGCGKLSSVSIPDSVKTIDVDAFLECSSSLYDQSVKKEVRIVDGWVVGRGFSQTNEYLNIPMARGMAEEAFISDRHLVRLAIGGILRSISTKAFYGCRGLESVEFLGPVSEIGEAAFARCDKLAAVTGMSGVANIAVRAFSESALIERMVFPPTLLAIGEKAFCDCRSLSEVEFLGRIPKFASNAFYGTKVNVTEIKKRAIAERKADNEEVGVPEYQAALEGAADARLLENITNDTEYASFLAWVGGLQDTTIETVKASPCAWLSYALDSTSLLAAAPSPGDVRIMRFVPSGGANAFDMSVSVAGVSVGGAATAANLAKVFAVEGAERPADGLFGTDCVNAVFGVPSDGLVKLAVSPKDASAKSFFFRVKLK